MAKKIRIRRNRNLKPRKKIRIRRNRRFKTRNEKRRERYQTDDQYRTISQTQSRRAYRRRADVEVSDCLYSLEFLERLATTKSVVLLNGKVREYPVFSIPQTASALQKIYQTVWRWVQRGQLPVPVLRPEGQQNENVYHLQEVRVFIEEIGKHEKRVIYYRRDHTDVRDIIYERVASVRKRLKIPTTS